MTALIWLYIGGAIAAYLFQPETLAIKERLLVAGVWPLGIATEIEWIIERRRSRK